MEERGQWMITPQVIEQHYRVLRADLFIVLLTQEPNVPINLTGIVFLLYSDNHWNKKLYCSQNNPYYPSIWDSGSLVNKVWLVTHLGVDPENDMVIGEGITHHSVLVQVAYGIYHGPHQVWHPIGQSAHNRQHCTALRSASTPWLFCAKKKGEVVELLAYMLL